MCTFTWRFLVKPLLCVNINHFQKLPCNHQTFHKKNPKMMHWLLKHWPQKTCNEWPTKEPLWPPLYFLMYSAHLLTKPEQFDYKYVLLKMFSYKLKTTFKKSRKCELNNIISLFTWKYLLDIIKEASSNEGLTSAHTKVFYDGSCFWSFLIHTWFSLPQHKIYDIIINYHTSMKCLLQFGQFGQLIKEV